MKFKISPLTGDASFRKFYRIKIKKESRIIVFANEEKYKNLIVYASLNRYLRKNKILAPKLFFHDYNTGILIIEDFGDLTFYKVLKRNKNKFSIYKKLVDLLLKIQKIKPTSKINSIKGKSYIVHKYSLKHLKKESNLFFDWYLPLIMNKKKAHKIKNKANKFLYRLYNNLNFPNSYFVHRDYHAQNLMKFGNKIGVIDSQDALIGNPAYDLVSLVDDVRIKTSNKLKNYVYDYYLKKTEKSHKTQPKKFLNDFNILSVQRSLKIIGIFSRLFIRDKKKEYLRFIPYAWELLERRMQHGQFLDIQKILNKNISNKLRKKKLYK